MTIFAEKFPTIEACQILTCLPEKFIVDFANGIDVTKDHLRQQKDRSFFRRLKEGISGEASSRQYRINAALTDSVQASLDWLTELTSSLATSNYAIIQVNDRLTSLSSDVASIAHYSADTRAQLKELSLQVHKRLSETEQKLEHIGKVQRGTLHMDKILSNWNAGRYAALPPAARCYITLEELCWGAFGDAIRYGEKDQANDMLETLKNRTLIQLAQDLNSQPGERIDSMCWLEWPAGQDENRWSEALNWMADWCDKDLHPVTWSVTQQYDELPLAMPRVSNAKRIADSLTDEVFTRETIR